MFFDLAQSDTAKRTPLDTVPPWNPPDLVVAEAEEGLYMVEITLADERGGMWTAYYKSPNTITRNAIDATLVSVSDGNMNPTVTVLIPVHHP